MYYEDFSKGRELESIIQETVNISMNHDGKEVDLVLDVLDSDSISQQITYRLINLEMNRERLKDLPYQVIEDMAKIYYLVVKSDSEGISSAAITKYLVGKCNVDIVEM